MVIRLPEFQASPPTASAGDAIEPVTVPLPEERHALAWDLMLQTGLPPDDTHCLKSETAQAWRRCLDEHGLPVGRDRVPGAFQPHPGVAAAFGGADIVAVLDRIGPVLSGAQLSLLVTTPEASLLYVAENLLRGSPSMRDLAHRGADWSERVLGNNGPGTAALTGQLAAFTGREHFSPRLHPYATVGLPLEDPNGRMAGVIGLLGDRNVGASVLLGVMGLIVRLLVAETPLRQPGGAGTALRFSGHRLNPRDTTAETSGKNTKSPRYTDTLAESLVWQAVSLQNRNIPILITGESGAGKEHLVRLAHAAGCRSRGPLVAINCASIPRDLIESELFGYEGGSFTGARSQGKPGKFQLADGGVLFLDEIGDMSFDLQATLLRVLETSEFVPVGGTRPVKVDVHVIAATNVRLLDAVEQGRFRRDLYYRLNGAQLRLPPLRERPDKRELIDHLLVRECELADVPPKQLSPELRGLFDCHPWPGNIRELRNLLRNLVSIVSNEVLTVRDLPEDFLEEMHSAGASKAARPSSEAARTDAARGGLSAPPSMEDWECHAIEDALRRTGGNIAETARTLGISRSTLYLKLQRYKLVPDRRCR